MSKSESVLYHILVRRVVFVSRNHGLGTGNSGESGFLLCIFLSSSKKTFFPRRRMRMAGQPAGHATGARRANAKEPGRSERGELTLILYLSINPRDNAGPSPPAQ